MTASYQIFCNGGYYYEPYSYYYVTDNEGNVILDNRDRGKPDQIISTESSTIMNRLLHDIVSSGGEALGYRVKIDGWDIIGKTGTTDSDNDNWFVGASPYAVAGVWAGHSTAQTIAEEERSKVHYLWRDIMAEWLKNKPSKTYQLGGNIEQHNFYRDSGLLTDSSSGDNVGVGYYTGDNLPARYVPPVSRPSHSSKEDDDDDESSAEEEISEESVEESPTESSEESTEEPTESSSDESTAEESPTEDPSEEEPIESTGEDDRGNDDSDGGGGTDDTEPEE